ncbi:MAG TPA: universal stress protein [Candidatus Methanoperedens sp.]|nr:universal stress protein [Candidatus Methanoperedens sp.]HLB71734.1 universal stress protein [Candidatus Methanoperedens sp.]
MKIRIAENLAAFFNAQMTIFTAVSDQEAVLPARKKQEEAVALLNREVDCDIEIAGSIEDAILKKSRGYDLIIIGPSTEWILRDVLFGSLPDKIIKESGCSVLILKQPEQRAEPWIKMIWNNIQKRVPVFKNQG